MYNYNVINRNWVFLFIGIIHVIFHCFTSHSQVYCALWHEGIVGRSGNDMTSAILKVLETIFEQNPTITNIITWSDGCFPQNRNSIMTSAMLGFY